MQEFRDIHVCMVTIGYCNEAEQNEPETDSRAAEIYSTTERPQSSHQPGWTPADLAS